MENNKLNTNELILEDVIKKQEHTVSQADETVTEVETKTSDWSNLFETAEDEVSTGGNQLSNTARLTQMATVVANNVFAKASADKEAYGLKIQASQTSHDAMDDLINECHPLGTLDIEFLKELDEDEIDKMIRSQQSKRSRAKSKVMTRENYLTMMVGAIAENLLRIAGNKPKSTGGAHGGNIGYSDEDLETLAQYPEDLTRAIRNVQSKKSIEKSKAGFDIESNRWKQLLQTEQQLISIRDRQKTAATEEARKALERQTMLNEMLEDVGELNPGNAEEMLASIKSLLNEE